LRQAIVLAVVTGGGTMNEPGFVEAAAIEAMTGAAEDAIAAAGAGPAVEGTAARTRTSDSNPIMRADHRDLSAEILAMFHFPFRPC
jgi:hypothetical protein